MWLDLLPYPLRRIWRPAMYQGGRQRRAYFEGWYFKLVDRGGERALAVIPGVSLAEGDAHAFVQVLDAAGHASYYHRFALDAFEWDRSRFAIRIGGNRFDPSGLALDLKSPEQTVSGELRFADLTPWPVSLLSPGIMGWYGLLPIMECYHGVISLRHAVSGSLHVDGAAIDFDGGRGYIEKDWGRSFPSSWVWLQTNHFGAAPAALTMSVARIPWRGRSFVGFIAGLWLDGELHRFATYTGARLEALEADAHQVRTVLRDRQHRLVVQAVRASGGTLASPVVGQMRGRIQESLAASVSVELTQGATGVGRSLFSGVGTCAGLEVSGDLAELTVSTRR